ncbi:alpha/beta fold hydrolase [Zavarzinia sp. CC-PAN008]|uniref:alpha/beta fold hydrolase n=1 Tax=Zavarzinia sp. CC-PAN008 TaxID=3243332 RepID=UPI003F74ACB9
MQERQEELQGADGTPFTVHAWLPYREPVGVIQVAHGMGEPAQRYRAGLAALVKDGWAVYANDHRGHGERAQKAGTLGDFGPAGFGGLVDDMAVLARHLKQRHPGVPLVLLGHSMGSFAAQVFLPAHADLIDALVLSGSADMPTLAAHLAGAGPTSLESWNAAFEPARTPFDWLSRDERQVDLYLADPLCGFTVNDAGMASMLGLGAPLADDGALAAVPRALPIYIFAGDRDPLNGELALLHALADRYRAAGLENVTERYYPEGRHEMLNETNRAEVTADLSRWLGRAVLHPRVEPTVGF